MWDKHEKLREDALDLLVGNGFSIDGIEKLFYRFDMRELPKEPFLGRFVVPHDYDLEIWPPRSTWPSDEAPHTSGELGGLEAVLIFRIYPKNNFSGMSFAAKARFREEERDGTVKMTKYNMIGVDSSRKTMLFEPEYRRRFPPEKAKSMEFLPQLTPSNLEAIMERLNYAYTHIESVTPPMPAEYRYLTE
jgi:hypothetical protein